MQNKETLIITARYVAHLLVALNLGEAVPGLPEGISLRDVYLFSKKHSVAGAVLSAIEDAVTSSEDSELIARFSKEREIALAKNLVQTVEFGRITEAFTAAEIRFLPMKGFLFKALWGRPEWRTMADMDIYVSADGASRAAEVLCSLGYKFDHGGSVHDCYVKPPYVNIELHKSLVGKDTGDFSAWGTKKDNPYWYVMSDEDFLVYTLSHMHKHHGSGGFGMRSLFDVYLYLVAKGDVLDSEYIECELDKRGILYFYRDTLALAGLWFGGKTGCTDAILELEAYVASGGTYGNIDNKVATSMRGKTKLGYYMSRFFLPYSSMVEIYKWLRPLPFLLPVAWVMRIFRALFDGRLRRELRAARTASKKDGEN